MVLLSKERQAVFPDWSAYGPLRKSRHTKVVNRLLVRLAIAGTVGSLLFSTPTAV